MSLQDSTARAGYSQPPRGLAALAGILDTIEPSGLLDRLWEYRWNGRPGYSLNALWRAYAASFILNHRNTNALIRRLQEDPGLRQICGFTQLPHRSTFNRFIKRLSEHQDMVEECLSGLTDQLAELLPGFGEKVAVDSTVVHTYSNPRRKHISDSEASWTAKTDTRGEREWHFGYKFHALADATYGIPITGYTTTAKRSDFHELAPLLSRAAQTHDWFRPGYVMADKGYDSEANHQDILSRGSIPIIAIRQSSGGGGKLHDGIYNNNGAPTCLGQVSMEYVRSDPEKGDLYRCPQAGCSLKDRRGVRHCQDTVWERPPAKPNRLFGLVRRGSAEWKNLYGLRQGIERIFKSLKQSRRLEAHCLRGLQQISLHATMSVLTFQATALNNILSGRAKLVRWMVPRLA